MGCTISILPSSAKSIKLIVLRKFKLWCRYTRLSVFNFIRLGLKTIKDSTKLVKTKTINSDGMPFQCFINDF